MDSVHRSAITPSKSRLSRTFAKVLHIRPATAIDESQKVKLFNEEDEKLQNRVLMDAFIAKVFATLSSVKAAYAQLQYSQSPYDPEGIQSADEIVVAELKRLSEFKQSFLKNHIDDHSPENTILLADIQEQKNLLKTYQNTGKKMASQSRLKDSEIIFLKEKLEEANRENKSIERRLNSSGSSSPHENLHFSTLNPSNFVTALKQSMKSIKNLVKFMITEMEFADWNLDAAAETIQPNVVYVNKTHRSYAFESFVCREMFDGFGNPNFSVSGDRRPRKAKRQQFFFDRFMELKYLKAGEYIAWKPSSAFAKFCWFKYLRLVHPKMESSLFGNLNQRSLVTAGEFPETTFFAAFAEAAKRIWLLHCLAFSLDPDGASIFQVRNGCRFSEVFMECVNEEVFLSPENRREVAFTVVPGFKLGKSVVQCHVYLS
ncbi:protein GRAVITROPIC IN THE LIGHT 1-like [Cynara cardunculus var. scolymus]|uniref:Uncharacterized protein n=1 Tax=Cynara cardunculus var. scolymus TaxID=59895 RepID=A0A103XLR2_CYNCS|nr:protein GRAVITROPIC IN THE LIGHT 1-like [Cynara cardunculus var. scolymus]KVH93076.1 protein of unknown function DUF641, plant [Cynara cardunculus var. scolymus]